MSTEQHLKASFQIVCAASKKLKAVTTGDIRNLEIEYATLLCANKSGRNFRWKGAALRRPAPMRSWQYWQHTLPMVCSVVLRQGCRSEIVRRKIECSCSSRTARLALLEHPSALRPAFCFSLSRMAMIRNNTQAHTPHQETTLRQHPACWVREARKIPYQQMDWTAP